MRRIVSYLEDDVAEDIKKLYKNSNISISKMASELMDIGYKVKLHHESQSQSGLQEEKIALIDKHTEYLLKIMAITSDIYRCIRNDKSKYNENTVDKALATIHARTQNFINRKLAEPGNN